MRDYEPNVSAHLSLFTVAAMGDILLGATNAFSQEVPPQDDRYPAGGEFLLRMGHFLSYVPPKQLITYAEVRRDEALLMHATNDGMVSSDQIDASIGTVDRLVERQIMLQQLSERMAA